MTDKPIFNSVKEEPCVSCGEETAVGSVFFSDRREAKAPGGRTVFVCSACIKRLVPHDRQVDLTDPETLTSMLGGAEFGTWGKF